MGGIVKTGNVTHDNNMLVAESVRQSAVMAATTQAAANTAELNYNNTGLASALANNVNTESFRVGRRQLGQYA